MITRETLLDRFLRYVRMDTQSSENTGKVPSTEGQVIFLKMLVDELKDIGLSDISMDEYGIVMARLPSNLPPTHKAYSKVPAIGFLAHVDTYFEVSGKDVKPQVLQEYDGKKIVFPADNSITLSPETDPELLNCIGKTVITSDGTTLLGADDKAGVAEIMEALLRLKEQPEILHGDICAAFMPDEETMLAIEHFDVKKFGAKYAYTIDGGVPGEICSETFCGDAGEIKVTGVDFHPGYGKGRLVNAMNVASELVLSIPQNLRPENCDGRDGYMMPYDIKGSLSEVNIKMIFRDYTEEGLKTIENVLLKSVDGIKQKYPTAKIEVNIKHSYQNFKKELDKYPLVLTCAEDAIKRTGLKVRHKAARGSVDGADLTFKGLPTPDLSSGAMNYHAKNEWTCLEWMENRSRQL